jgi:hypothetical protein
MAGRSKGADLKRIIGLAVIGLAAAGCTAQPQATPTSAQQSAAAAAGSSVARSLGHNTAVCKNWASLETWASAQDPADLPGAVKDMATEMAKTGLYASEATGQLKTDLNRAYKDLQTAILNMSSADQAKIKADDQAVDNDCA